MGCGYMERGQHGGGKELGKEDTVCTCVKNSLHQVFFHLLQASDGGAT